MHTISVLGALLIAALILWGSFRGGLFLACYALVRDLFGFLLAMTLCEPLGAALGTVAPTEHPWPAYSRVVAFVLVYGVTFGACRYLRLRYTRPNVRAHLWLDRVTRVALSLADVVVVTGMLFILWGMMPFAKYLPGDFGRIRTEQLPVDTGAMMLRFYGFTADRMGGGKLFLLRDEPVLLDEDSNGKPDTIRDLNDDGYPDPVPGESYEDLNGNGVWDRGHLWRYRTHADIHLEDVYRAASP